MDDMERALLSGAMESAIYWGQQVPDRFTVAHRVRRRYGVTFVEGLRIVDMAIQALRKGFELTAAPPTDPSSALDAPINPRVVPGHYEYHVTIQAADEDGTPLPIVHDIIVSSRPLSRRELEVEVMDAIESERYDTVIGTLAADPTIPPVLTIARVVRGRPN